MSEQKEQKVCDICSKKFEGWGNNPWPYRGDYCCDDCNEHLVVPTRIFLSGAIPCGILFDDDGTIKSVYPTNKSKFTLEELQYQVLGYIEPVHNKITKHHDSLTFFVNEEGLLKDMKPNALAFQLFNLEIVGPLFVVNNDTLRGDEDV